MIRCFPQIRTLTRKNAKREFLSLFLSESREEQEQLFSEIISAGFTLHILHDASGPWAFALLCRALQWRRGDKSMVQGVESGCLQSSVMSHQSSTTEGSLEASGSQFNLYPTMDIMPWGFYCCFCCHILCLVNLG